MRKTLLVTAVAVLVLVTFARAAGMQKVHFVVHVPDDTPAEAVVYLAGSLPAAGEWKAAGVKLEKQADKSWACDLELETGQTLEYKFTLGSWETVEKKSDGGDVDNRKATIDAGTTSVDAKVEAWSKGEVPKT